VEVTVLKCLELKLTGLVSGKDCFHLQVGALLMCPYMAKGTEVGKLAPQAPLQE
jgi:hypothetical protein